MEIPLPIKTFLDERKKGTRSPCENCNSICCKGPGFAILENVLAIYNLYQKDLLIRNDFIFEKGLTLSAFIFKYFDRTILNGKLLVFFPKILSDNKRLLSIPPWNFWQARDYIMKREKAYGCIFLDHIYLKDNNTPNKCILHDDIVNEFVTQKPIDCLFLHCTDKSDIVIPTDSESALWFSLIDYHFRDSINRFNNMCPDIFE